VEIEYKKKALEDRAYWKQQGDLKIQGRITELIEDISEHPFTGIGKPEPLKYE
jgi:toxin YoeB